MSVFCTKRANTSFGFVTRTKNMRPRAGPQVDPARAHGRAH